MKAILMSDRPKWCALMMNGDKKVEVRKGTALYKAIQKLIDEYGFADFYVYCTKKKPYLGKKEIGRNFYNEPIYTYELDNGETFKGSGNKKFYSSVGVNSINGKVIFKFRCYKVEELFIKYGVGWQTKTIKGKEQVEKLTQLSVFQLFEYCGRKTNTAIHISDLEVFDKPKELSEFYKRQCPLICMQKDTYYCDKCPNRLTKAPQSFAYIEVGNRVCNNK